MEDRTCSVVGCGKRWFAAGWCHMHYNRWHRGGTLERKYEDHGMSDTTEYTIWKHLRTRCSDPIDPAYKYYGARGISVCPEWEASFAAFFADMGPRPSVAYSIDRIDNDGPYAPDNCRWATQEEQSSNRRDNRKLTWQGETLMWAEWAKRLGLDRSTIHYRVNQGWPVERVLGARAAMGRPRKRPTV